MGSRMFTAVLPSAALVSDLDELLESRRDVEPALRWSRPEAWHLTTSFMADVQRDSVDELVANLAEVAGRSVPFPLRVEGGLAFPNPSRAKVLALGVSDGNAELGALSAGARRAASRAGVEADGTRFVGHLTVARSRAGVQASKWIGLLDSFPGWSWQAEELCLVESHRLGRHYEVLEWFALGASA